MQKFPSRGWNVFRAMHNFPRKSMQDATFVELFSGGVGTQVRRQGKIVCVISKLWLLCLYQNYQNAFLYIHQTKQQITKWTVFQTVYIGAFVR